MKGVKVFDRQHFDRETFSLIKSLRYKDAVSCCIRAIGKVIDETCAITCHSFRLMQMGTRTGLEAADVSVLGIHVGVLPNAVAKPFAFDW